VKIYPSFDLPKGENSSYCSFLESIGDLIDEIVPSHLLVLFRDSKVFAEALAPVLPLIRWTRLQEGGNAFEMTILCQAQFSHGTGRFLSDALSRRLIPGKIIELGGTRTLSFFFSKENPQEYLINQRFIIENDPVSAELISKNLPLLAQELQVTLLTIFKVRHFLSLRPENLEGKAALMQEIQHLSPFEEMHQIIRRLAAEKTNGEIRDYIAPVYLKRPKVFDRDIFEEIKPFINIYNEKFIGNRTLRYVARLVCYHFYFKKLIEEKSSHEPLLRQILLKVFRGKGFAGILLSVNLFGENEVLKKHHLVEAVRNCLPEFEVNQDSFCMDAASEYRPIFYIEAQKKGDLPISSQEITTLRTKLPLELKQSIQSVLNPLFMLRNGEDQLRQMVALSRELRFVKDIPQIVISFEDQTIDEISFSVVLLRVQRKGCLPIKELLSQLPYKMHLREVKNMGLIRNKYPKELAIFKVSLPKRTFLRKDHSLDLPKARQELLSEINTLFKEVRDFNGGLLSKQLENLQDLKELLGSVAQENGFLLENYFFSLEPLIAQTSINPSLLEAGFLLLLKLIKENSRQSIAPCKEGVIGGFVASSAGEKESFISFFETARDPFEEMRYSSIHIHDLYYTIVFFISRDLSKQQEFEHLLQLYSADSK